MSLAGINWRPSERQLRQFGWIGMGVLPLAGWVWSAGPGLFAALVTVAGALGVLALVQPKSLHYPFVGLCLLAWPIGLVTGELVVLLCYFLVFVPFAVFFRLRGRDALQRALQGEAPSYWQPKLVVTEKARYFRQW